MIGLYLHIPFCRQKCLYCDFPSWANRLQDAGAYIDGVIREAEQYRGVSVDTVFVGGGTPSILPPGEFRRMIEGVGRSIDLSHVREFSAEANPNSFTRSVAEEFAASGINRVSLGLQSAEPRLLKRIGRLHSPEDFTRAVEHARAAGIHNINGDLMYSLPGQTLDDVAHSCDFLLQHPVMHVSAYALKLEPGTPLYGENPTLPDEDLDREMFRTLQEKLEQGGFHRYEISNFAKDGCRCAHNLIYWQVEDYIGLGAGAHSCYRGMRFSNQPSIDAYLNGEPGSREPADPLLEKIMLGTRLTDGIESALLPDTPEIQAFLKLLVQHKLACLTENRFRLTDRGMDIQNEILAELFTRI